MSTPNTGIPYVPESTLDPAAGLNLALNVVDALLQTAVLGVGVDDPPASPAEGDLYIVGVGTGAWVGQDGNLARYVTEGAFWQFYDAGAQVRLVLNLEDRQIYVWTGSEGWQPWPVVGMLEDAADDAAAAAAGVPAGGLYRNGSALMVRVA